MGDRIWVLVMVLTQICILLLMRLLTMMTIIADIVQTKVEDLRGPGEEEMSVHPN